MKLQALASDYDDTLARGGRVSAEVVGRLQRVRDAGILVVLITGRRMDELHDVFDVSAVDFVVAENGGYSFRPDSGVGTLLAPAADLRLVSELQRLKVSPLHVGEAVIATLDNCLPQVEDAIAHCGADYQIIRNRESLMLLPHGVDKGSGLKAALGVLGVSPEETVAVGDAENDVPLLAAAGHGVSVGDGVQILQEHADFVTGDPGPAGFIQLVDLLESSGWVIGNSDLHVRGVGAASEA